MKIKSKFIYNLSKPLIKIQLNENQNLRQEEFEDEVNFSGIRGINLLILLMEKTNFTSKNNELLPISDTLL